ncbi:MAG: DUF2652 domain-containing protein [Saprospiraceae bacterium]|nr:DUF2652 domain-containing protein [Saprospiraceae bacterium]
MAANNSLLLIPDISGFTDFVHNTEISHAQHIISELLEILIDANTNNLELAEIEGDALFYYKHESILPFNDLLDQIKRFYLAFHHHLSLYENRRICQCGACTAAADLNLKFVVHIGAFEFIEVKGRRKPIGSSVIAVHRLLKNKVPSDEYVILTDDYLQQTNTKLGSAWTISSEIYEHLGEIKYHFKDIHDYKNELEGLPEIVADSLTRPLSIEFDTEVNRHVLDVYELLTNFNYRRMWNSGLDALIYDETKLNQVGVKHTCVIDGKHIDFESIKSKKGEGQWIYGEQTEDIPFMKRVFTYNILKANSPESTTITVKAQFETQNLLGKLMFPIIKRQFAKGVQASFQRLKKLAESSDSPI